MNESPPKQSKIERLRAAKAARAARTQTQSSKSKSDIPRSTRKRGATRRRTDSQEGDFMTNISPANLTYNEFRKQNKMGLNSVFFILFKSCTGVGLFFYPYAVGKAGYLLGSLLCLLLTYMSGYCLYSLADLATKIERSKFGFKKMHSYSDLAFHVGKKFKKFKVANNLKYITTICCVLINTTTIIRATNEIALIVEKTTGLDDLYVKACLVLFYMVVSIFCIEPERLKQPGSLSGIMFLSLTLVLFGVNYIKVLPANIPSKTTYSLIRFGGVANFCGIGIFATEGTSTLFTIRESMQDSRRLPAMIMSMFAMASTLFLMFNLSFYFVLGNENIIPIDGLFILDGSDFMNIVGLIFCVVIAVFVPLFNIANSEFLEVFKQISGFINNKNGEKNRTRLLIYRWILFVVTTAFSFIGRGINDYLALISVLTIPIASFYIPIFLNFAFDSTKTKKSKTNGSRESGSAKSKSKGNEQRTQFWVIHDLVILGVGLVIQVLGLYYVIVVEIVKGEGIHF